MRAPTASSKIRLPKHPASGSVHAKAACDVREVGCGAPNGAFRRIGRCVKRVDSRRLPNKSHRMLALSSAGALSLEGWSGSPPCSCSSPLAAASSRPPHDCTRRARRVTTALALRSCPLASVEGEGERLGLLLRRAAMPPGAHRTPSAICRSTSSRRCEFKGAEPGSGTLERREVGSRQNTKRKTTKTTHERI